ncbi:hypothetical protein Moror_13738, partial [Moniliophthora roreri MCA 2997]
MDLLPYNIAISSQSPAVVYLSSCDVNDAQAHVLNVASFTNLTRPRLLVLPILQNQNQNQNQIRLDLRASPTILPPEYDRSWAMNANAPAPAPACPRRVISIPP